MVWWAEVSLIGPTFSVVLYARLVLPHPPGRYMKSLKFTWVLYLYRDKTIMANPDFRAFNAYLPYRHVSGSLLTQPYNFEDIPESPTPTSNQGGDVLESADSRPRLGDDESAPDCTFIE